MRYLICGGRNPTAEIREAVRDWVTENCLPGDVVIHGKARGVDTAAMLAAKSIGVMHCPFPADWKKHGRAAGPIRNKQMLTEGKPDVVVAFPGGRGTANMVQQAQKAGVPVVEPMT